ncbi:MAG: hypothetical protein WCQ21_24595 [Verrucomicrobiota bacterium]
MPHYITQKIMEAIEDLIGQDTPENRSRLASAALKARLGALPAHRQIMSQETLRHLSTLEREHEFYALREAFVGYVLSAQGDAGIRDHQSP